MRVVFMLLVGLFLMVGFVGAEEVAKGKIPGEHMDSACKALPWGCPAWDVDEAVAGIKDRDAKILWVDTRPSSFFKQGTVRDAVLLVYDQTGKSYPDGEPVCTKESLEKAMAAAGADMVVFFCQGPKCHRSYNAAFVAVNEWGLPADKVVWFRAGYPNLFKAVGAEPKLKRKAARYLCDAGAAQL